MFRASTFSKSAIAALLLSTMLFSRLGRARDAQEDREEWLEAYLEDVGAGAEVDYCIAKGATNAAKARAAYQRWREQNGLDDVKSRLGWIPASKLAAQAKKERREAIEELREEGNLREACNSLIDELSDEKDVIETMPEAAEGGRDARSNAQYSGAGPGGDARGGSVSAPAQPHGRAGTLYTVAQLSTLLHAWEKRDDRNAQLERSGTFYIQGTVVEEHKERYFLEHDEDGFLGDLSISLWGMQVSQLLGRKVVVSGSFKPNEYYPTDVGKGFLNDDRAIVSDPSGLVPSTLAVNPRVLRRRAVTTEQVRAAPGKGVKSADVVALFHHAWTSLRAGGGLDLEQETYILLKGGWAYKRTDIALADLDVEASRRLQPQHWARWKAQGKTYQVLAQDDQGKPSGNWQPVPGNQKDPWRSNQRLSGSYKTSSFSGSVSYGGTSSASYISFSPNGRFDTSHYTNSGTGFLAAEVTGVTVSAASASDKTGTRSVGGGGNTDVYARSASRSGDGSDNRGTYRFDGYVLELRYDNGKVARTLSFPGDESVYMWGTWYLLQKDD